MRQRLIPQTKSISYEGSVCRLLLPPNPRSAMATRRRAALLKENDPPPGKRQRTAVGSAAHPPLSAAAPSAPAPAPDPPIEFAGKDDVDALLNEKMKVKNKMDYQRSDLTTMETVPVLPDELILSEILVRLPAKKLLRCGAACRTWRRLTSTAAFLLAHHRRQPSLPLVSFHTNSGDGGGVDRIAVDTLDFRRSPAARQPVLGFKEGNKFTIHASCDGLLILSLSNLRFYVCNPATRQWCMIPALIGDVYVVALYLHRPSGEYRVLYWKDPRDIGKPVYYVVTLGSSQKPRCISPPMASPFMRPVRIFHAEKHPPVVLHSCLHYHPARASHGKVTIFDTVLESFRLVQSPTAASSWPKWVLINGRVHSHETSSSANLVEIDGTLGITHIDDATMEVKLWVLQDYDTEVWSLKRRIELPLTEMKRVDGGFPDHFCGTVVLENLDMLLSRPYLPGRLFYCDGDGKLVKKFPCDGERAPLIGLCFRESLVRHEFFPSRDGRRVRLPCMFRGL